MIEKRKNNAYRKVNEEMILLYLEVGKFLYELKENSNYGDKITTKASDFMKNNYPSVGVILCSSKDEDVVEYSISKNMSQTMISEYKLKLIDKKLLETKLKEMKNLIDNNDK